IVMGNPDKNSDVAPVFEIEHEPSIFDCFPRSLEQKSMLRINIGSFTRRNAKELRVKFINLVDKATALGDRFSSNPRLRVVVALDVPTVRRHIDDAFATSDEQLPERVDIVYPAGETATDSDNGNTFFLHDRDLLRRGRLIHALSGHVNSPTDPSGGGL